MMAVLSVTPDERASVRTASRTSAGSRTSRLSVAPVNAMTLPGPSARVREGRGCGEAVKRTPPILLRCRQVMPIKPGYEIGVRYRCGKGDRRVLTMAGIQRHDFAHHEVDRSSVDQQVVSAPDDAVCVIVESHHREAEQWRDGQIEAASTVVVSETLRGVGLSHRLKACASRNIPAGPLHLDGPVAPARTARTNRTMFAKWCGARRPVATPRGRPEYPAAL